MTINGKSNNSSKGELENYTIVSGDHIEPIGYKTARIQAGYNYYRKQSKVEIQNYGNNIIWPLEYCPKCKSDLREHNPDFMSIVYFPLIITNILSSFIVTILLTFLLSTIVDNAALLYISSILIFAFTIIYVHYSTVPKFYICKVCHCLLYHNKTGNQVIESFQNKYYTMFGE